MTELAQLLYYRRDSVYDLPIVTTKIAEYDLRFQVTRYLHSEHDQLSQCYLYSGTKVRIDDLTEIRRPIASLGRHERGGIEVRDVSSSDIGASGQLRQGSERIRLPVNSLGRRHEQLLEPGNILLTIKGGLNMAVVVQAVEHPTLPGQTPALSACGPMPPHPGCSGAVSK